MSQYTDEHFDEDHMDAHREHMDFAAQEAAELRRNCWGQWIADVETSVGHSMDGDQIKDGYSLDYAHDAFNAGYTATDYAKKLDEQPKAGTMEADIPTYDYKNQAWVSNGVYVRCGHPESMACDCYGKLHEGEQVAL